MAWATLRTFKDATAVARQAIIGTTATAGEDKPLYNPVYGPDGADPTVVTQYAGLPIQQAKLSGAPTSYPRIVPSSAAATGAGNVVAVGGTGGSAVPGLFLVQLNPAATGVVSIGDTNVSAFAGEQRGHIMEPGGSVLIGTDDLRAWKASFSVLATTTDALIVLKVGS